jgi:hypothetical protein
MFDYKKINDFHTKMLVQARKIRLQQLDKEVIRSIEDKFFDDLRDEISLYGSVDESIYTNFFYSVDKLEDIPTLGVDKLDFTKLLNIIKDLYNEYSHTSGFDEDIIKEDILEVLKRKKNGN